MKPPAVKENDEPGLFPSEGHRKPAIAAQRQVVLAGVMVSCEKFSALLSAFCSM